MMASELTQELKHLNTPLMLVDLERVKNNCERMRQKCDKLGIHLRPHMKTHKTVEGGILMTGGTKRSIVVSTIREAEFFAEAGFEDILYASLFTEDKIPRLNSLCVSSSDFHVLVDSEVATKLLISHSRTDGKPWSVFMKIDCGSKRVGLPWDSPAAVALGRLLHTTKSLHFKGLYIHEGNAYHGKGRSQVSMIGDDAADKILQLRKILGDEGICCDIVATGSTPSCSLEGDSMKKLDEFHPGNYIFMDYCQSMIGSCAPDDIAISVATRVIGQYPERGEVLVDCGWTALSLDGHGALPGGSYAYIEGFPHLSLYKMTQEVGFIKSVGQDFNLDELPVGKILFLLPHHSCATSCMHDKYHVHNNNKLVEQWQPCRGW